MPRMKDPVWKFYIEMTDYAGGGTKKVTCKFCGLVFAAHVERVKAHLAGVPDKGYKPCPFFFCETLDCFHIFTPLVHLPWARQQGAQEKTQPIPHKPCPSLPTLIKEEYSQCLNKQASTSTVQGGGGQKVVHEYFDMDKFEAADLAIARCFYTSGLSFNLANHEDF